MFILDYNVAEKDKIFFKLSFCCPIYLCDPIHNNWSQCEFTKVYIQYTCNFLSKHDEFPLVL